jgi:large repetitive protein
VTPPSGSATDYAFDAYGDLASAGSVSYGYDALGRMDSRTVGSGSATSLSYLGTGSTLASDGTNDYSYTPSGLVTAVGTPGGTAFTTMTDQHGDVVGTFSPTSTAEGLAGYSSYSPYGAETSTNFGETSATRATTPIR